MPSEDAEGSDDSLFGSNKGQLDPLADLFGEGKPEAPKPRAPALRASALRGSPKRKPKARAKRSAAEAVAAARRDAASSEPDDSVPDKVRPKRKIGGVAAGPKKKARAKPATEAA